MYIKKRVVKNYPLFCVIILSLTLLHTDANALFCLNQDILTVKKGSDGTATSTL